jgi:hypothetical protein
VLGTLLSLKHELRVMTAQKSGSIINISSTFRRWRQIRGLMPALTQSQLITGDTLCIDGGSKL